MRDKGLRAPATAASGSGSGFWRWLSLVAAGSVLLFATYVLAIASADRLLVIRTALRPADVIVVLGGDWRNRASRAAALFRAGLAPRVLASGAGDCDKMRQLMIGQGVPRTIIAVECASRSTIENAAFSAPILAAMGARSGLLVTSWFHARRALAGYQKEAPAIHWISAPVVRDEPARRLIWRYRGVEVAEEYLKLVYYAMHYGTSLFPKAGETGDRRGRAAVTVTDSSRPRRSRLADLVGRRP
jgi:uncharacterized SAM-binding protein YcdF (DUF218 family)